MKIQKLQKGDTIGFVCPSHIAKRERHEKSIKTLQSLGFSVKLGQNVYKDTYGYLASEQERADDFNGMVCDESVKMVLFGGGEGANELLPYIDYEAIKKHPKFICSFSDGTTILNAVNSMAGITTYYGQGPGMFNDLRHYDYMQFSSHFIESGHSEFKRKSEWRVLKGGSCEGILVGGYTRNFAMLLGSRYFRYDANQKYILFLEDNEMFSKVAKVSSFISHVEQSDFAKSIAGLIFGHYSEDVPMDLLKRLERFGLRHGVPVVYTDDFGHGTDHAIFPIGARARLDADKMQMAFI
ncbi:MAG: S66 peptidase family protein [Christensenellales bacterium]|jgi:muramoyltetrapeptide carboxypeptidase